MMKAIKTHGIKYWVIFDGALITKRTKTQEAAKTAARQGNNRMKEQSICLRYTVKKIRLKRRPPMIYLCRVCRRRVEVLKLLGCKYGYCKPCFNDFGRISQPLDSCIQIPTSVTAILELDKNSLIKEPPKDE